MHGSVLCCGCDPVRPISAGCRATNTRIWPPKARDSFALTRPQREALFACFAGTFRHGSRHSKGKIASREKSSDTGRGLPRGDEAPVLSRVLPRFWLSVTRRSFDVRSRCKATAVQPVSSLFPVLSADRLNFYDDSWTQSFPPRFRQFAPIAVATGPSMKSSVRAVVSVVSVAGAASSPRGGTVPR
jgi:hypothetical protein